MFGGVLEANGNDKLDLPKKVWNIINSLWAATFLLIAAINVYFVLPALSARNSFLDIYSLKESETIKKLTCESTPSESLCLLAQQTESSWVNFKLFGTMGITITVTILSVVYLMTFLKEEAEEKVEE